MNEKRIEEMDGLEVLEKLWGEQKPVFSGCFKTLHEMLEAEKKAGLRLWKVLGD